MSAARDIAVVAAERWEAVPNSTCSGAWFSIRQAGGDPEDEVAQTLSFAVIRADRQCDAVTYEEEPAAFVEQPDAGLTRARAALLAAAPALFEACEGAERELNMAFNDGSFEGFRRRALDRLREAIALVKGGRADENSDEIPETLTITTGDGCGPVEPLDLYGLTMEEAEEIADEVGNVVSAAYGHWSPEMPDESDLYQALTEGRKSITVRVDVGEGEHTAIEVFAGTHCGQPIYALETTPEYDMGEVFADPEDAIAAAVKTLDYRLTLAREALAQISVSDLAQELRAEIA